LESGYLIATIFGGDAGFEKTGSNGVEIIEPVAVVVQRFTTLDFFSHTDNGINAIKVTFTQADGHAQFTHVAIGTGDFDGLMIHWTDFDTLSL
jgi:hypothetical protein